MDYRNRITNAFSAIKNLIKFDCSNSNIYIIMYDTSNNRGVNI